MSKQNRRSDLDSLLRLVSESYDKKSWHGPNLRGSLRGLSCDAALWRPGPNRHNIWEILIHCAYWKYVVRRRILGEKKGSFPLKGSNWFESPAVLTPEKFRKDIHLIAKTHRKLLEGIAILESRGPSGIPKTGKTKFESMIRGIGLHDVYHAGQIQLLRKLQQ